MRSSSLILGLALCAAAASAAWSSEDPAAPASPTSPSSPVPATPAAEPTSARSATPPGTPAAAATVAGNSVAMAKPGTGKDAGTEQQIRELRSRGYRPENRGSTTVWCRTETTMGSRFETKKCATAEELDMAAQRGKDFKNTIENYGLPKGKP
jgi:hypothetical protein